VDDEIAALHERNAHFARQERVLEIGRIADAGCEDDDRRVGTARWRQGAQCRQEHLAVVRDRAYGVAAEQAGEHPLGDFPVGQHVRHAARHPQVVLEHHEAAVVQSKQIGARNRDVDVAVDPDATHFAAEVAATVDQVAWHDAVGENAPFVVDVLQKQIDCREALREAAFQRVPLGRIDDARQQVERKDALRALIVSVDGKGDAARQKRSIGFHLMPAQLVGCDQRELFQQRAVHVARPPGALEHLIERGIELVLGEQRLRQGQTGC
jgi:hypothetical protein